jgi:hypothetical protein
VPSVASEVHNTLSAACFHASGIRSQTDTTSREPATPFAELLDSTAPVDEPGPAPNQGRTDAAQRTDRSNPAKSDADRSSDPAAAPAKDGSDAKSAAKPDDSADVKAKAEIEAAHGEKVETDADTDKLQQTDGKAKPDADQALGPVVAADVTTPVAAATPDIAPAAAIAPPVEPTPDAVAQPDAGPDLKANPLAALEAAGPQPAAPKAAQGADDVKIRYPPRLRPPTHSLRRRRSRPSRTRNRMPKATSRRPTSATPLLKRLRGLTQRQRPSSTTPMPLQ